MNISNILNINIVKNTATLEISGVIGIPADYQFENSDGFATTKEDLIAELKAIEELGEDGIREHIAKAIGKAIVKK